MNSKPILFTGENVSAILDDRKSMTRRLVKRRHYSEEFDRRCRAVGVRAAIDEYGLGSKHLRCPYGKPGDLLWVRETWRVGAWSEDQCLAIDYRADGSARREWLEVPYEEMFERLWIQSTDDAMKAGIETNPDGDYEWELGHGPCRWRSSIFMPRWASRLTLRISNVRVERLQEITVKDIMAEGVRTGAIDGQPHYLDPTWCENVGNDFVHLWDSINAKRGYSWESNPWVWVIEWDKVWRENVGAVLEAELDDHQQGNILDGGPT